MRRARPASPPPALLALGGLLALLGCPEDPPPQPQKRFAAVKKAKVDAEAARFCERTFPTEGQARRAFHPPPQRPIPGYSAPKQGPGWTWVNLWASWCAPCIKEMPLLKRWGETLRKEGVALNFELLSIDEVEAELLEAMKTRSEPFGAVRWLERPEALPELLEQLGVDKGSAIPIHALVDPQGNLRCVRVGAVHEGAYGAIKTMLTSG